MDSKGITGLLLAVTIGAIFFVPVTDVLADSTGTVEVQNETVTTNATYTDDFKLDGYDVVSGSETVEVYDSGNDSYTALTEGTDYTIDYTNGTVSFESGGSVSEGDEVRASYDYEATSGLVTTITDLLPVFLGLLLLVPMANKVQQEM
jgi:hypothetical protein